MDKIKRKLQEAWEENPLQTVAVGALALTALTKFLDVMGQRRRDRVWEREVDRRIRSRR